MLLQNSSSLETTSIIYLNCVELINLCMKLLKVPWCTALKNSFLAIPLARVETLAGSV